MRLLLSLTAVLLLSACRVEPPGATDVYAAQQILFEADRPVWKKTGLSADSLDRALALLDRATAAGHPFASSTKAFTVMVHEGHLAAEPHFRAVLEDPSTTQRHRDQAYGMLASIAGMRPRLEAGLQWRDIPPGQQLAWSDVPGAVAVLQEARAAGSQMADSTLRTRLDVLHRQRDAGNADADSLLALLERR